MDSIISAAPAVEAKPRNKRASGAGINSADKRLQLKPHNDPYWKDIVDGRAVGWRKPKRGDPGTWKARARQDGEYKYKPLDVPADMPEGEKWGAALKLAQQWFEHLEHGGNAAATTVAEACAAYIEERRTEGEEGAAKGAEGTFRRYVYGDAIANIELSKLSPNQCASWKRRVLEALTAGGSTNPKGSFNRTVVPVVAALNLAHRRRNVASNHAWAQELKKFAGADGTRKIWLDAAQRSELLACMSDPAAKLYFTALCMLPVRPQVPAHLTVANLDAKRGSLHIPVDKEHAGRTIVIGNGTLEFFKAQCANKLPSAFIFTQADGSQWNGNAWQKHVREAVAKAGLPAAACAYSIRHGTISDMLSKGASIFHVARIAGTSPEQIMKTYGHMYAEDSVKALATLEVAA